MAVANGLCMCCCLREVGGWLVMLNEHVDGISMEGGLHALHLYEKC